MSLGYRGFPTDGSPLLTPCQRACPVGTDVSAYIAFTARGEFEQALAIVREVNPFPEVCGRVCDHACESYCRRADSDAPVAIRAVKRMLAEHERAARVAWPSRIEPWRAEKVAVIGSGPAGLTAASDLLRHGFRVSVFEASPKPGGMMRFGIPDYRLPPDVLDYDIEYLTRLGVAVAVNCALGRDFTIRELRAQGINAVVLATGAHGSRHLQVPGGDWPGMLAAIDFLRQVKLGEPPPIGPRVVVVGGGDVAMDAARTALRLGATRVDLFCLETRDQMPAHDWEIKEALDEQIVFHCGWGKLAVGGEGSSRHVTFAACTALLDEEGRFAPSLDLDTTTTIDADTMLVAIGQYAQFAHAPQDGIETTEQQLYRVNPETLQTTVPWVFASGDAVNGTATVIQAVASGHRAAAALCEYLDGRALTGRWEPAPCKERLPCGEFASDWEERPVTEEAELASATRVRSFAEVKSGLTEEAAIAEAARCMRCDAETKSYTYSRAVREQIYHQAHDIGENESACLAFLQQRLLAPPQRPREERVPALNDLVFLPANLTRLVIDPYREACSTRTVIGARAGVPIELAGPIIIGGLPFDGMEEAALTALCNAASRAQVGLRLPAGISVPTPGAKVIGVAPLAAPTTPLEGLSGVELTPADSSLPLGETALRHALDAYRNIAPSLPIGISLTAAHVERNVQAAVEAGADFVTLSAMGRSWRDDTGLPDIETLARAVEGLREINREEDIDLLYFGGVRSGSDVAVALAMGATAVVIGQAANIALGTEPPAVPDADRLVRFLAALLMEASMLARCCGKTDVHNLEPEDLRSLTVETSRATGLPLVGSDAVFRPQVDHRTGE